MCSKDSLHVDTISMLYLDKLYSNDFKSLSLRNVQPCSLKADRLSNQKYNLFTTISELSDLYTNGQSSSKIFSGFVKRMRN